MTAKGKLWAIVYQGENTVHPDLFCFITLGTKKQCKNDFIRQCGSLNSCHVACKRIKIEVIK